MNEIKIFENPEFGSVRTIDIDNDVWFVGKDVAVILGYSNPSKAVSVHVDVEDKQYLMLDIADSQNGNVPVGQTKTTIINESGLYSLILSSKLPKAKEFKRWVTADVLPAIRKHGVYAVDEMLNDPDTLIAALVAFKEEKEKNKKLIETVKIQEQQIAEFAPKVSYYDIVLNCKDLVPISTIAKDYGKSAKWMNKYLHSKKIQYKQGRIWLLYQKYSSEGYTNTRTSIVNTSDGETHTVVHMCWTQKGRLFIYEQLKADGILPLIEIEQCT